MTDNPAADQKQRFLFPDSDIRGELVRLDRSLAEVLGAHDYPMAVQGLVGEAVAAVALLTGTLKFEGRLSLQAQGRGPVSLLLAECTHDGQLRALARHDERAADCPPTVAGLIGDGTMVITITPDRGRQYQGIVPLEGDTLARCLEGYFQQSEQLPTRLWLAAGNGRAAGMLLQRLPDRAAGAEHNAEHWQHLETLADTLTMEELLDLDTETVLRRLFHETPPRLPAPQPLRFGCTCSRERTRNALLSLGAAEIRQLLDEDGEATLTCDFCLSREHFDAVDLAELAREAEAR
ncbi:Hsp33 family molecular chaperone HslO [Alloalcanivorax profundimaris]|uniref:33 kDa chaperonin n=1 Tax=Alloalcanivorax profundimaris TaxID=2735259 RepID=A0ABS0AV67_9GAMM|nr:Hsp33 family molecular chaperone HslO [Alloalcanivorax profundimaris]MAO60410.1 Hsp33 family molecular chaperone HslO [Alcanivorax sp.]MBM1144290.1 Hsp33 family molecular chaperone HslO [Alcanivorax sp. ZXX171]MCQ6260779.1 Hsp33 family molecular chaperone HslO [Alcanivorax sp. MM125-6]UWN50654.1 33 kDa chaperonin [Alcanivorax sp. ALC70]MBF1802457.1 Hsp33 family molecular chaperone HslO [Alloalcanivorax profundimaris]